MNTSGQGSPSAFSVSVQTRSATSALASPSATICRISAMRFVGHAKAQRRVTRGETRHAQDAHRVFDERLGHVPQQARVEIAPAAIRIDDVAGVVLAPSR